MEKTKRTWERINEESVKYKTLLSEMRKKGYNISRLATKISVVNGPLSRKLRGGRQWKLWEAIEIKRILHCDLPLEALFEEET